MDNEYSVVVADLKRRLQMLYDFLHRISRAVNSGRYKSGR